MQLGLRIAVRDLALALMVLGLVFLNFGHLPAMAGPHSPVTPSIDDSWCGNPLLPDQAAHAPCHACRFDGAALPPAPVAILPVTFASLDLDVLSPLSIPASPAIVVAAYPRGPPGD